MAPHDNLMAMSAIPPIPSDLLHAFLDDDAAERLRTYFHSGTFTGGRFESLAGGGDRAQVANSIEADDIVAVSLLSVHIPGRANLQILETRSDEISKLLREVPTNVDLWDAPDGDIAPGSPADRLWALLERLPGSGWVTAGKLLARKRPRLIPVYDQFVHSALQRPAKDESFWLSLREALRSDESIVDRLRELKELASLDGVSLLRVLDVAIWMKVHGEPEPTPAEAE